MRPWRWSLGSEQACPRLADRAEGGGAWEATVWSGEISGARVPVQIRIELTFGCAVAAQLLLCSGEELEIEILLCLLSPQLLSQLPDSKFPSCDRVLSWDRKTNTTLIKFQESTWISFHYPFVFSRLLTLLFSWFLSYPLYPVNFFVGKVFLLIYWVPFRSVSLDQSKKIIGLRSLVFIYIKMNV